MSVRMSNGAAGAGVARAVTQGMAARAGLAPLAAARAGNQVAGALNGGRAPVVLGLATEPGRLFVLFTAAGDELDRVAGRLPDAPAVMVPGGLGLWFDRPPLHSVPD